MNEGNSPKAVVDDVPPTEADQCQHHWLIEPPTGPTSNGTCRVCGEERAFENYHFSNAARQWGSNS